MRPAMDKTMWLDSTQSTPNEAQEKQRRLQKTDAQVGRQFGQMLRVLLGSLVGVDADVPGVGEAKRAKRSEPLGHEVADQALTQNHLRRLIKRRLCDVQNEQYPGQLCEHAELPKNSATSLFAGELENGLFQALSLTCM